MKAGTIKKIMIKNFITYSYVEMCPGPNLNVVLGPNGTGKSAIIAAIILGLGGSPKTIGRGTKVSEYVKHGNTEAKIDIELQGNAAETITITRIFNLSNQNKWYINNKSVSDQSVKQLMDTLHIQVDNLCQCLPQDRVQDFAKMNKKELLRNTQKAVGRQDLVDKHTRLIEIKDKQKNFKHSIETINKKFEDANVEINRLIGKVESLKEKQRLSEEIKAVKRKKAWEYYNKLVQEHYVTEKLMKQATETLHKCKKGREHAENNIDKVRLDIGKFPNEIFKTRKQISSFENTFENLIENNDDIEFKKKNIAVEMNSKLQALLEYQNEMDTMRAKIDKLANDEKDLISKYGDVGSMIENAKKLEDESNTFNSKSEECNRKRMTTLNLVKKSNERIRQLEDSVQQMENIKEKRLRLLERRDQDAYKAVLWLRDNKNLFTGQIYEPIMLELNVVENAHAKYLENIIPMRDRVAFTCENRQDMNLFMQKVRDELDLRVNVVHSDAEHQSFASYHPQIPIEQLRKFGFFAYVTSLITGPEPILKYLCRMYMIHNIPIGDESTYSKVEQLPQQLKLFFSESHRFAVSISRYSGEKSTRISDVTSDGTFSICIDYNSLNNIKRELEETANKHKKLQVALEAYESQTQTFESKRSEALKQRQQILQTKEQIVSVRDRIATSNHKLNEHMKREKSEHLKREQIRHESNVKLKALAVSSVKLQQQICATFGKIQNEIRRERTTNLEYNMKKLQITHMENEMVDLRKECEEAEQARKKIQTMHEKLFAETSNAKKEAKKQSDGCAPDQPAFSKFREEYDRLPSDVNVLNNLIDEYQTKLECLLTVDDDELKTYENAQNVLRDCQTELDNKEATLMELNSELTVLFTEWMEPLQELVQKINKKFGEYFESMGCAGEVAISHESGVKEYADYGLCIRVTYRGGERLQELNQFVQSGGERTVATAIYMLSMQDLTVAPFRCVDEINQGMDPQNERRIFEILVNATKATAPNSTQYFFITPKLISGLQYGEDIDFHIIYNGPYCNIANNQSS